MGDKTRRSTALLCAFTMCIGSEAVAAQAASATACTTNYVCIYQDKNYGGDQRNFANTTTGNYGVNLTGAIDFNDEMSSWQSRRPKYSLWSFDINGGGERHCINPNWNVSQVTAPENDKASSVMLYGDNTTC